MEIPASKSLCEPRASMPRRDERQVHEGQLGLSGGKVREGIGGGEGDDDFRRRQTGELKKIISWC